MMIMVIMNDNNNNNKWKNVTLHLKLGYNFADKIKQFKHIISEFFSISLELTGIQLKN